ncbi:SusD/RagB family nutrient-binding outer membrane lipoprotein [Pinibacter aurantiacus]|uniref:SusD/RagB family nutrient-binding outer membrane lipoprotein n=1 Tax=Pinibacter aurantiacus TaxID=2851599 RepID=A0A9E2SGQ7_9BACT|nr:SusD/RagB family nutrient-binding outer membrane lipoprotein [Pinibacter aurantiacus]MBV4360430.1 SusD/RagB family nutrient-binding outer membrane lipoprotein [Pinibacter aurantiacus]
MKYVKIKSAVVLTLLLSSVACKKNLDELYQNPDGYSNAMAQQSGVSIIAGFFTSQLSQGFFLTGDYGAVYHQLRSGNRTIASSIQAYNVMAEGSNKALADVEHDWGTGGFNETVFNMVSTQWMTPILWAQREYNNSPKRSKLDSLYINLLHVLKGYAYQRATDMYDKVPYIETGSAGGLDHVKAKYIGQSDIYPKIISDYKDAEAALVNLTLSSTEQASFTQQDILFGGSILQWRKYINSLRLRAAMNVSEAMPQLTTQVLTELQGKPLLSDVNDVAGISDVTLIALNRICNELGITRSYRERVDECRAGKKFLQDVMYCTPTEVTKNVNGKDYTYFSGENSAAGLAAGTVDPRVSYIFAPDWSGRYIGMDTKWDGNTDPNSYLNKMLRGNYINDAIMTDVSKTTYYYGVNNSQSIALAGAAKTDLAKRDSFLLANLRSRLANYDDNQGNVGTENPLVAELNIRPEFNFAAKYPTISSVETELSLAEAAVRNLGTVSGSARDHYKNAIILSCKHWYNLNINNNYSKSTLPALPTTMDDSRINARPAVEYNADAYAEFAAQKFDAMSSQQKVQAIFNQLQLHYGLFNFEVPFTAARRLIKYVGTNPAAMYETFKWKERMTYPSSVQASDPDGWAQISGNNNPDLPVWLTGRTTKWKNALE